MRLLCRRRHETIKNMAQEFDVSERTIRRDIEFLSLSQPIYTQPGRYKGGVYVTENFNFDRMYFSKNESTALNRILKSIEGNRIDNISLYDIDIFRKIVIEYTKPTL